MAESLVTQVARTPDAPGKRFNAAAVTKAAKAGPSTATNKNGVLSYCFGGKNGDGSTAAAAPSSGTAAASKKDDAVVPTVRAAAAEAATTPNALLPPVAAEHEGRKCLVLDLDETLVHSAFTPVAGADIKVGVEIDNVVHQVYVLKRPGVDEFLREMGKIYEVVIFTASLGKYANPLLDQLDIHNVCHHRLFRESCTQYIGNYTKDLTRLGRPLAETIIIDNSPTSYMLQPENAIPCASWFDDPNDTELTDLIPFLKAIAQVPDVRTVLDAAKE